MLIQYGLPFPVVCYLLSCLLQILHQLGPFVFKFLHYHPLFLRHLLIYRFTYVLLLQCNFNVNPADCCLMIFSHLVHKALHAPKIFKVCFSLGLSFLFFFCQIFNLFLELRYLPAFTKFFNLLL